MNEKERTLTVFRAVWKVTETREGSTQSTLLGNGADMGDYDSPEEFKIDLKARLSKHWSPERNGALRHFDISIEEES